MVDFGGGGSLCVCTIAVEGVLTGNDLFLSGVQFNFEKCCALQIYLSKPN